MQSREKIKEIKELISSTESQIAGFRERAREKARKRFESNNGCSSCRGRGWVVTWDTLDSITGCYAQYGDCPEKDCTSESRARSGLSPTNTKYDSLRGTVWKPSYTPDQNTSIRDLESARSGLQSRLSAEIEKWKPTKGKVVRVFKNSRVRNKEKRVPIGITGIIIRTVSNSWGTSKFIIRDKSGKEWWPTISQVEVLDPDPDRDFWDSIDKKNREQTGYPSVVTIKRKSSRAALVRTTTAHEFWIPFSQVSELSKATQGSTISISLPIWLAKKNGLVR